MARTWTQQRIWQELNPYQRAAAMAIMEADGRDPVAARNVLGAIINRSEKTGDPLGDHVSRPIYQPTIEPTQLARLPSILQSQQFRDMTALAEKRANGEVGDWIGGNTHFLAHERVMEGLRAREPNKYRSWVDWTGYNRNNGRYANPDGSEVFRDNSHAFLAPDGRFTGAKSVPPPQFDAAPDPFAGKPVEMAKDGMTGIPADGFDPMKGFARPGEVLGTQPTAAPTLIARAPTPATPDSPFSGPLDDNSVLHWASAFWEKDAQDKAKAEAGARQHMAASRAAIPDTPGTSPMINGPRLPRIDMRSILAVLKERGVDPDNSGGLGTGGGILGTRRA